MKNPPCVRGLKPFEKRGCPQRSWDGDGGCPCWIEMSVSIRGDPMKKEIKKQCIDRWTWEFQWATLGLLEGNQKAVESFRNGMIETGSDNKDRPKPDPAMAALIGVIRDAQNMQKVVLAHEIRKQIEK